MKALMRDATSFEPFTVLYVDNNPDDLSLMQLAVTRCRAGFQLQCFLNILAAKQYLAGTGPYVSRVAYPSPILVLVDFSLEGELGTDLIAWIRSEPQLEGLTTILLSDGEADGRMDAAYEAGANHCLRKPGSFEELVQIVECLSHCVTARPASYTRLTQLPLYRASSNAVRFVSDHDTQPGLDQVT